jgi:hypothetical protein
MWLDSTQRRFLGSTPFTGKNIIVQFFSKLV